MVEQRDLRFFLRQTKPVSFAEAAPHAALIEHLGELSERAERRWGLRVQLTVDPLPQQLSEPLVHAVYRLLQETLANAARHGVARLVRIRLSSRGDHLRIEVLDDGCGFEFRGRYDLPTLNRLRVGPESIKQRVASLGGQLVIVSEPSGAQLEIELPLAPATDALVTPPLAASAGSGGRRS